MQKSWLFFIITAWSGNTASSRGLGKILCVKILFSPIFGPIAKIDLDLANLCSDDILHNKCKKRKIISLQTFFDKYKHQNQAYKNLVLR